MNLQESIRRILREDKYDDKVGRIFWFEYHCYESPESCDSEIWYRSHQKVKVIGVSEWSFDDYEDRMNDGQPRVYLVEWKDGFQYDVFEDELLESPNEFYRPNPPKRKIQESIRKVLREESDEVMNMQSKILSQFRKQDQMERNEYSKFVQSEFGGDYERGAKEYAKIKNRNSDDIFGDKKRIREFILINFDFNTFSSKDWENYWLLSQHSDNHPEFQKKALNIIKQNLGEDNEYYEYLHDRISCRESGTQIYGTQNICKKSKMNLQESIRRILREENKKSGLLKVIEEDGLFQVIQDTGLSMGQIILKYDNLPREVFERYIKDFIKHDGYHQTDGSVQLGYEVEIQTHVYTEHFYMKGDRVTVEIRRFDNRGQQTEGYIESLSNLTDDEIFNIVDDMTSWGGDIDYKI